MNLAANTQTKLPSDVLYALYMQECKNNNHLSDIEAELNFAWIAYENAGTEDEAESVAKACLEALAITCERVAERRNAHMGRIWAHCGQAYEGDPPGLDYSGEAVWIRDELSRL